MRRVPDVIDVWFDSGAMPFAQWHYPFEHQDDFESLFPAQFISEAVDQTRGWFYSLVAISTLLRNEPCFLNCLVNEFIVDEDGQKMSKSKGNIADPWEAIRRYGADALRWYMLSVSQPWLATRYDIASVGEVKNRFFDTWKNTYAFFALYASIDGLKEPDFSGRAPSEVPIDRWLLSRVQTVTRIVGEAYDHYDLTRATRTVADFLVDDLSNWYVRLNRRRFWGSGLSDDKLNAYATLYQALVAVSLLSAPVAPFFSDTIFRRLTEDAETPTDRSIHLSDFPEPDDSLVDESLEAAVAAVQKIVSLGRAARMKTNIKVRQPAADLVVILPAEVNRPALETMQAEIQRELNVKKVDLRDSGAGFLRYTVKPNFAKIGKRLGSRIKALSKMLEQVDPQQAADYHEKPSMEIDLDGASFLFEDDDLLVSVSGPEGYHVESDGGYAIGLNTVLSEELITEGYYRELINKIQNLRKTSGLAVTDRIRLGIKATEPVWNAIEKYRDQIASETLSDEISKNGDLEHRVELKLNGQPAVLSLEVVRASREVKNT